MVRIWVASLHQKASTYASTLRFLFCNKAKLIGRVDSNSCGAVAEDSAKTAQWAVFSSAARAIHPRPPRTPVSNGYRSFCFICLAKGTVRVDSNSNSDDRCQRQKQGGAVGAAASRMRVPPKARCSRWESRPGFLFCAARDIHPRPQKNATYPNTLRFCFFTVVFSLRPPIRAAVLKCCFEQ